MSNMVVNTNVLAINAHNAMAKVGQMQSQSSARLSSGSKINSAADDAAGLAISEKMKSQVRGLDMASKNAQDGISLVQTADGGMAEMNDMVQRIRELTVQSANDTNQVGAGGDTEKLAAEASQLVLEISSESGRIEFNKKTLLNGSQNNVHLQIGANAGQQMVISIGKMTPKTLKLENAVKAIRAGGSTASASLKDIDAGLSSLTSERAKLGAYQNRLQHTINSLDTSSENLAAANSRIADTDMAKEMMNLTKANVLGQAAQSMLSQANQAPQSILQLLR